MRATQENFGFNLLVITPYLGPQPYYMAWSFTSFTCFKMVMTVANIQIHSLKVQICSTE